MEYSEFEEIVWDDHPDYEEIQPEEIYDQDRWHTYYSKIVKQASTNKFFSLNYARGSTEMQDDYRESMGWSIYEVRPKQITKTIYEIIK